MLYKYWCLKNGGWSHLLFLSLLYFLYHIFTVICLCPKMKMIKMKYKISTAIFYFPGNTGASWSYPWIWLDLLDLIKICILACLNELNIKLRLSLYTNKKYNELIYFSQRVKIIQEIILQPKNRSEIHYLKINFPLLHRFYMDTEIS